MPSSDTEEDYVDTDLHIAVRYGDYEDAKEAIQNDCNPNSIGMFMWSPLHEASQNGDIKILRLLLKHKGDANHKDKLRGCTALHHAAREGHVECVKALLQAGGLYNVSNLDGESPLDVATDACEEVLQRQRVKDLIKLSKQDARKDAEAAENKRNPNKIQVEKNDTNKSIDEHDIDDIIELDSTPTQSPDNSRPQSRAWGTVQNKSTGKHSSDAVAAYLQLSFEYNAKKESLKVRVWQITDLLLPPPENSTISTIYVKSYIYPDKKKNSKRKTEEVRMETPLHIATKTGEKLSVGKHLSVQTLFQPCTFKFTRALEYNHINKNAVEEKVMEVQVFITQKYTRKSFIIANMTIPLDVAVKKLVRERFPVKPCMQETLPETMQVFTSDDVRVVYSPGTFSSNPNLRNPSLTSLRRTAATDRAHSDSNLKRIEVHNLERIPSVEINMPLDGSGSKTLLESISVLKKNPLRKKPSYTDIVMPLDTSGNRQSLKGISVIRELENPKVASKSNASVSMPGEISSDDLDSSGTRKSLREITVVCQRKESVKSAIMNTSVYIPGDHSSDEPAGVHVEHPPRLRALHRQKSKSTPELTTTSESEMSELESSLSKQHGLFASRLKQDAYSKIEKGKYKKRQSKSTIDLDFPLTDRSAPELTYYGSNKELGEHLNPVSPRSNDSTPRQKSIFAQPKTPRWEGSGNPLNFEGISLDDMTPAQKLEMCRIKPAKYSPGGAVVHYEDDLTGEVTPQAQNRRKSLLSYQPKSVRDYSPSKRSPRKDNSPYTSPKGDRKVNETSFSIDHKKQEPSQVEHELNETVCMEKPRKTIPRITLTRSSIKNTQETSFSKTRNKNHDDNHNPSLSPKSALKTKYLQHATEIQKQAIATPDCKLRLFQRTSKEPHPATPFDVRDKDLDLDSSEVEKLDPFYIPETPPTVHSTGRTPKRKMVPKN